ncbi:transporter substrate-binding domain-containing protein [Shewanella canadensis]|uniref:Transporter substrate-binding domain-containing protein n=1 Tax=Shewanella canadensis TaxID=271096 RepID=A0A431WPY1_9GAMM|nr:transporter substrate-binding domain-containing protein [Shewanella canadensis]RTR37235.1 transporter substrate-binding domain-containing protein [Shewanella canadensis]
MVNSTLLYLTLLFTCLISGCLAAQPLKIVCHEFAPFSFQDVNQTTGILVEIAQIACRSWEDGCEIELLPNRRAKQTFNHGLANGHFMGWNEDRAKSIWFSIPLLQTEYGFYSLQNKRISKVEQLAEKNVGVLAPSNTYESLLEIDKSLQQLGHLPMNIIQLASANEQPIKMLAMARFNAYFVNRDVGAYYADRLDIQNLHYLSSGKVIQYHLGFKIQFNKYETIKSFNHHLESLFQQGVFDSLFHSWNMSPPKLNQSEYLGLNIPY